jgi:enoyl-CoA hydratase/carnithine racemase
MSAVLLERSGHVATVTLNQPDQRNAFTPELMTAFKEVMDELTNDAEVRAVVVTGAGKGFSAGAHFNTLPSLFGNADGPEGVLGIHAAIERLYATFTGLGGLKVPTVAAVNGAAVGGGLGIALQCDLRLVAEDAKIGANFARLGIHPGMGITARLIDAVGSQAAAELLYTGRLIRGREAAAMGLFRKALPADEVLPAAQALAAEIAEAAPLAVRCIKRTVQRCVGLKLEQILRTEAMAQAMLAQSADASEGIQALLAKRTPEFKGQ